METEQHRLTAQFVCEQTKNALWRGFKDAEYGSRVEPNEWTAGELNRVLKDRMSYAGITCTPAIVRACRAAYYVGRAMFDEVPGEGYKD